MADDVLVRDGPVSVPMDYQVPLGGELLPLVVRATVDGAAAGASFYAVVQVIAPSGRVMGNAITTPVAAGGSADVTWFPHVGGGAQQVYPPPPGPGFLIYDYHVTGAAKNSIDTAVDGAYAGAFVTSLNILEVWLICRTTAAAFRENLSIQINGDTGANYDLNWLYGFNASITNNFALAQTGWLVDVHGSGGAANVPSLTSVTIPGYSDTSFYKVGYESTDLYDTAAADFWTLRESMGWRSAAQITRLTFTPTTVGSQLQVGTHVMIYGR